MPLSINECFCLVYKNSIVAHDDIFGLNVFLYELLLSNDHPSAKLVFGYQYIESKRIAKKHVWVEVRDELDNTQQLDILNKSMLLYLASKEYNTHKLNVFIPFAMDTFSFQASKDQSILTKFIPNHTLIVNKADPIFSSTFKILHSFCNETREFKVELATFWFQHTSPITDVRDEYFILNV